MKKDKILSEDGSEFTVFYLKNGVKPTISDEAESPPEPFQGHFEKSPVESADVYNISIQWMTNASEIEEQEKKKIKDFLKKDLDDYLASNSPAPNKYDDIGAAAWDKFQQQKKFWKVDEPFSPLDDTIESDIVKNPVFDKLYRVRVLNKIARFKGHTTVEGVVSKRYFQMSHHGQEFHVPSGTLLKISQNEEEKYLGKQI